MCKHCMYVYKIEIWIYTYTYIYTPTPHPPKKIKLKGIGISPSSTGEGRHMVVAGGVVIGVVRIQHSLKDTWSQKWDPTGHPAQKSPFTTSCIAGGSLESLLHATCHCQSKNWPGWRAVVNLSSQQLHSGPLWHHGLVFPTHVFQPALGQARCSEEASALLAVPSLPTLYPGQHFVLGMSEPSSPCGFWLPHSSLTDTVGSYFWLVSHPSS